MFLSNGAVAGALMGCKFGFKNLPEDLLNFPHRKWLDRKVQQFLKTIGLIDEQPEDVPHREQKDEDVTMEHSGIDELSTNVVTSDSVMVPNSDPVTTPPTGDDVTAPPTGDVTTLPTGGDVTTPPTGDDVIPPPTK